MKKSILILFYLCIAACLYAQVQVRAYTEQVRTLRVSNPFLVLQDGQVDGSDEDNSMEISFDEMSHDVHQYSYTVHQMSADWSQESGLTSNEYLSGFTTQDITDFEHSINTSREYTHYRFWFPNSDMILTKSGNYLLTIYEDGNPDKRVAEVKLCVVEPLSVIQAQVRSNTEIEFNGRYQQVDLDVTTTALNINDPNEVKVLVRQNNRTDNQVWVNRPTYVENGRLRYINNRDLIFEGGNEYHHWDAFSVYYAGTGIDRMFYEAGDYHALLFPNEVQTGTYIHQYDSDGRFVVNAERTSDPDTEAEYVWVHFTLPVERPWLDGAIYIGGEVFGNEKSLRNRMQYDNETHCYWLTALVKQGGYNYQFWFSGKGTQNKTTTQRVDGSFWQTENEYAVYVYWRPFGARYDRLVGLQVTKSGR
ncbi:MAG: DUF5103 domain-containing protein [Paludibacteraceae bacterium]|nr:DUF5103 domain-containing protein [Paludibacteraceae bacterium]